MWVQEYDTNMGQAIQANHLKSDYKDLEFLEIWVEGKPTILQKNKLNLAYKIIESELNKHTVESFISAF